MIGEGGRESERERERERDRERESEKEGREFINTNAVLHLQCHTHYK